MIFMNNFIQKKLPISFNDMFKFNYDVQVNYRTRQANYLFITRCKNSFANKLPLFEFPKIWNKWKEFMEMMYSHSLN